MTRTLPPDRSIHSFTMVYYLWHPVHRRGCEHRGARTIPESSENDHRYRDRGDPVVHTGLRPAAPIRPHRRRQAWRNRANDQRLACRTSRGYQAAAVVDGRSDHMGHVDRPDRSDQWRESAVVLARSAEAIVINIGCVTPRLGGSRAFQVWTRRWGSPGSGDPHRVGRATDRG